MATSTSGNHSSGSQVPEVPWDRVPSGTAAALRSNLEPTVDEVIHAIRTAVPAYAGPLEGAFGEGIRTAVAQALSQFLDKVEGRQPAASGGSDLYFDLGRGEARAGRSLEALLAAYRVGARVAWRATVSAARAAGFGAETLSVLAEAIFAYIDELSGESIEGYATEQAAAADRDDDRRDVR